jgi:catechol 2,3-dioxygenase-like lactoylglutathione lyase family enzyme
VELKLELVLLPVSDVDRAKAFYVEKVGFNLDVDTRPGEGLRVVQNDAAGLGTLGHHRDGDNYAVPGSVRRTHLVTSNVEAARAELVGRGVDVSEIFHFEAGNQMPGPDPPARLSPRA